MPERYREFSEKNYAYFVTCTLVGWEPVLAQDAFRLIVLESLAYLREYKRTQLNAFVVMPSHLHAVLWPYLGVALSDVVRDFKRFTSRSISKEAIRLGDQQLLNIFANARQQNRTQDSSQYQVWQEGSHPEAIFTARFARQKIEYIHNNPVKAGLVSAPEDWPYSSAKAYLRGEQTYPMVDLIAFA